MLDTGFPRSLRTQPADLIPVMPLSRACHNLWTLNQPHTCLGEASLVVRAIQFEMADVPKYCSLITALCGDVKTVVEGLQKNQPMDPKLIQGNRKIYAVFKDDVRSTCPNFVPRKRNDKNVRNTTLLVCRCRVCTRSQVSPAEKTFDESDAETEDSTNAPIYLDDMRSHIMKLVM